MTPLTIEEKNRRLAEWLGWKFHPSISTDLNALAEVEAKLTIYQFESYRQVLVRTACTADQTITEMYRSTISASAAQRFRALGITLQLWKETDL